jgi:hypothetical protein
MVWIEETPGGLPLAIRTKNRQRIADIEDTWRLDDEWWRPAPLSRRYYAVTLLSGQRRVIFKDLITGLWYTQSY